MLKRGLIGAGGATGGDAVGLLMHFDGSFADSSLYNTTPTVSGSVTIDAASKFGSGAALFSGGSLVQSSNYDIFGFGTADYTVEFWFYTTFSNANSSYYGVYQLDSSNGNYADMRFADGGFSHKLQTLVTGGRVSTNAGWAKTIAWNVDKSYFTGKWSHVALVVNAGNYRLFVDGLEKSTVSDTPASGEANLVQDMGTSARFSIGTGWGGDLNLSKIDDFRVTKRVARYTENFTPPTEAFPNP